MVTLIKLLPLILQFMGLAEKLHSGIKKSGGVKKEFVTEGIKEVINTVKDVSTGGQKETWDKIAEPVSTIIDSAATILFESPSASEG